MFDDPIVEEVRKIREQQAEKYEYDLEKIIDQAQKRQQKSKHKTVSFATHVRAFRSKIAQSGKGEVLPRPPHTTGHAGPHPAVPDDSLRIVKSNPEVSNGY